MEHTGALIRFWRVSQGLKQDGVAREVGITQQELSKMEAGKDKVSDARLKDFARVLDVPVDVLKPENGSVAERIA